MDTYFPETGAEIATILRLIALGESKDNATTAARLLRLTGFVLVSRDGKYALFPKETPVSALEDLS